MGILSEILSEVLGQPARTSTVSRSSNYSSGKADPFANNSKKTNAKSNLAPKNVPISQQKTALEMHSQKQRLTQQTPQKEVKTSKPQVACKSQFDASNITVADMRKAVVMSEILGKPKCKR